MPRRFSRLLEAESRGMESREMSWLIHLVDGVMVLVLVEFLILALVHRRTGRGVSPGEIGLHLLSGFSLMVALRCALAQSGVLCVMAALLLAGIAHGLDLRRRWRR
jgi:hypothetical protein